MGEQPLRAGVIGAAGRMGAEICSLLIDDPLTGLAAAIEHDGHPLLGEAVPGSGVSYSAASGADCSSAEVLICFATAQGVGAAISCAREHRLGLVIGTTGSTEEDQARLDELAGHVAVLESSNMSLGVNLLFHLTRMAASSLPGWDAEVLDLHHGQKIDAPSGTALSLAECLVGAGEKAKRISTGKRYEIREKRSDDEVGVAAIRAGDIVGEHTVFLVGEGERVELTHRCQSRRNFAAGAVQAAKFLRGREPGRYSMDDVLGLST